MPSTSADPARRYRAKLAHLIRQGVDSAKARTQAAGYAGGKTKKPQPESTLGFPYAEASDLPEAVRHVLPPEAQQIWLTVFNSTHEKGESEAEAAIAAWSAVKRAGYTKNEDTGRWVKATEWVSSLIKLAEEASEIEILRCGNWTHPEYGQIAVTEVDLDQFAQNFKDNVRRIDLAIDQAHKPDEGAAGWFRELVRRGQSLFAKVEWTPIGKYLVQNNIFRYISPEFSFKYKDDETGRTTKNVLYGAALTNRPFIKGMAPVLLSEDQAAEVYFEEIQRLEGLSLMESVDSHEEGEPVELKELRTALKLSEEAGISEIQQAVIELLEKAETADTLAEEKETLAKRLTEVETKLIEADWRELADKAKAEGRMTPKQEAKFQERYMKDPQGTKELIELLEPVVGFGEVGSQREVESHVKLFEEKVTAKVAADKLGYAEAVQAVAAEDPALWAQVDRERRGE